MPPPPWPDFTAIANHYEQLYQQVAQQAKQIKQIQNESYEREEQITQLKSENKKLRKENKKQWEHLNQLDLGMQAMWVYDGNFVTGLIWGIKWLQQLHSPHQS